MQQQGNWTIQALPAGTNNIGDVDVLTLPALPAGTNNIGDVDVLSIAAGDNNIGNVDIVTLPALVAGTANIGDVDVLTLPALPSGTNNIGDVDIISGPTGASALQHQGASASGAAKVGNPAQVGGVFNTTQPTVTTGQTVEAQCTARGAQIVAAGVEALNVTVNAALPAGTNNIGDVDVLTLPALVAGTANIGDVDVLTMPTGASAAQVQGPVAHDAPVAQNPVRVAFRANLNEPAAVSADGDTTEAWGDLLGRQVVLVGHSNPEPPVALNVTASGNTTVIAAPGASLSLYIMKGTINNRDTTNRLVALTDGAAGTTRFRAEILSEGGWAPFDFGSRGWKLTANTALVANLDAVGNVDVNIMESYIAA